MNKILVTGGCGYIGAHTIVDLIENGFHPISIDNNSRSTTALLTGIKEITGVVVKNYKVDLCDFDDTHAVFQEILISKASSILQRIKQLVNQFRNPCCILRTIYFL